MNHDSENDRVELIGRVISINYGRRVYECMYDGSRHIVKLFETKQERDHESRIYNRLSELQGDCIPIMYTSNVQCDTDNMHLYGIVIDYIEIHDRYKHIMPTTISFYDSDVLLCALKNLERIHDLGVAHCDVKEGNILVDQNNKVYIIDFSHSCTCEDVEFNDQVYNDNRAIQEMINKSW